MSDRPSLRSSWLAHYAELISTWTRRCGNRHDAEDATHDAIANMLEQRAGVIANPRAFLHRSVHNGLVSLNRRAHRQAHVAWQDLNDEEHPFDHSHGQEMDSAHLRLALQKALNELPLKSQQIFAWHRLEGYTLPEIARKMNLSQSMVEKHMARALDHLHKRLSDFQLPK
ncbi:RNA polymerase sigma factor [Alcaligenes aquatilis]|uniref:RNA polymerase sigma factor n=1 Tax=Alcaligenes aquatilis TaxID=323284 RepID=UPI003F8F6B94